MAESTMSTQYSKDGKYFAQISIDGKLNIWVTGTSTFKQEFTPDLHLKSPCTCLHWIQGKTQTPGKKRKLKSNSKSSGTVTHFVALGTSSGSLLLYSFASANVETTVDSNTSNPISCITWYQGQDLYAGAEEFVLLFDLNEKTVKTKWKTGTDKINAILVIPNHIRLLTAAKTIKLWDLTTKENLKTFTGHSSDVSLLHFISSTNADPYFVSGSKGDRLLSCWNLNENASEKNSIASLLMEDVAVSVSLIEKSDNPISLAAVTRSGVVHIYQYTLNGKCSKPIKPKVTIQVASDPAQNKMVVTPIPIIGAFFHEDASVMIAHGMNVVITFENVVPSTYEKVQCLIRKLQFASQSSTSEITKTKTPIVDENVEYLTPFVSNNYKIKRKGSELNTEVPMEQRLENLTLNRLDTGVPKQDNVAQLLIQGLRSKDKSLLGHVLSKRDETVIKNTVKRLPMPVIVPLLTELSALVQGKTLASQTGVIWLRYLVQAHASQLLANPNLVEMVGPVLGCIENRLTLLTPLSRLRGRLDLLVSQISDSTTKNTENDDALLLYKDIGVSDSESEDNIELNLHSDSENEWVEEDSGNDSNNEEEIKIDENNVSDSEMSM